MNCTNCVPQDINDLDNTFDAKRAEKEARAYLQEGIGKRAEKLIAYLVDHCTKPMSVLDIGCGVGGAHYELLRRGKTRQVVGVEASSAYIEAAERIGDQLGLRDRVEHVQRDFAQSAEAFDPADVVILDRVICCYPHLEGLLDPAAGRANRYLALSYPREAWWVRAGIGLENAFRALRRQAFRTYLHPHADVMSIAGRNGMKPVHNDTEGSWQITVFERIR
jgi:2-polyprenyl-3-methyl-5-hydroxy-6-metoxy-1,4-benzoquinol methylase